VAVVQYTFTHKQYTERKDRERERRRRKEKNNKKPKYIEQHKKTIHRTTQK
jgi:hypothetical protein